MKLSPRNTILSSLFVSTVLFGVVAFFLSSTFLWALFVVSFILLIIAISDTTKTRHTLLVNYPLIARLRWVFENQRPKIQQYLIENNTNGTPYNYLKRSDVYQKAKEDINTVPFGTQLNVYSEGYEFIKHSMFPIPVSLVNEPRVTIGSDLCKKPYSASIYNISAMSYGALSDAAIRALNGGAKLGNFYHNTGEGGVSSFHLENKGDLCFQIGTGYFGCGKTIDGKRYFDEKQFIETISNDSVKMIELKLSQGAKPGHGGILPASKNTKEIATIRGIEPNVDVMSPAYHTSFWNNKTLLEFIEKLRDLSDGLPIGIKLCVGDEKELSLLIESMNINNSFPDFISIDGGEGGTGAAPLVFTNSVGMPLIDSLVLINKILIDNKLRNKIKIIASGKASTSFDIIKLISLGADVVSAARAFMLSLGCIQARECNLNTCPVGIATQNKELIKGLDSNVKKVRVFNYHKAIIHEVKELCAALGKTSIFDVTNDDIMIRDEDGKLKTL